MSTKYSVLYALPHPPVMEGMAPPNAVGKESARNGQRLLGRASRKKGMKRYWRNKGHARLPAFPTDNGNVDEKTRYASPRWLHGIGSRGREPGRV